MRRLSPVAIVVVVLVAVTIIGIIAATTKPQSRLAPPSAARIVTIVGRDEQGNVIDPVMVWKDYADRSQGVAGQAHDGDRVTFLSQQGGATQIQLSNGARGWVNSAFIK